MKKYLVTLTDGERAVLGQRVAKGRGPARELTHARILLKADQTPDGPAWADTTTAAALDVSVATIERVRKRFVEQGLDAAETRCPRPVEPGRPARYADEDERRGTANLFLWCEPPRGGGPCRSPSGGQGSTGRT